MTKIQRVNGRMTFTLFTFSDQTFLSDCPIHIGIFVHNALVINMFYTHMHENIRGFLSSLHMVTFPSYITQRCPGQVINVLKRTF